MSEKILIGMSGGVDSSVAALLLLQQGFSVTGATMLLRPEGNEADAKDAAHVCAQLGIPHLLLDFRADFKQIVMHYFTAEYLAGRTPNPCVVCNPAIKFGKMLEYALQNGFDAVATGHYAVCRRQGDRYVLSRADSKKDQSYVLYGLSQHQLAHIRFPLTDYSKEEIRQIAAQAGLQVAAKADSQEVCFIPDNNYIRFIEQSGSIPPPGDFIDAQGRVLGTHGGIHRYTIGQRKGLGITFGAPRYVTKIDGAHNTVTLGPEGSQYCSAFTVKDLNYILFEKPDGPFSALIKVRYQDTAAPGRVTPLPDGRALVELEAPRRSVTPGQSAVFYSGSDVIGGGRIENP